MSSDKLGQVRKPRVHIKYEVETEEGVLQKELPFVVGVMGDYAGNNPGEPLKNIKERKFINIDNDNFDKVMERQKPGLQFSVPNVLTNDGSEMKVDLQFNAMQDFEPDALVEQIPALKELKTARDKLRDLLSKTDRSTKLEELLEEILQSSENLQSLAVQLEQSSTDKK